MASSISWERHAPYAPVSAFRAFLKRIGGINAPPRVDRNFLRKLGIAPGNEWALLSALKFLAIVDDRGAPTDVFRQLQTQPGSETTIRRILEQAYAPLLEAGGRHMSDEELRQFFAANSSASQARNAARFFRQLVRLASLSDHGREQNGAKQTLESAALSAESGLRQAKMSLLGKLPPPHPDWSPSDYLAVYDRFLRLLENIDATA